jgi:hypothetical protein
MFRKRTSGRGTIWMRLGLFASGVLIVYCGLALLKQGVFAYHNYYRAVVYSPELVVLGGVFMLLALVPNSLVARLIQRGKAGRGKGQ